MKNLNTLLLLCFFIAMVAQVCAANIPERKIVIGKNVHGIQLTAGAGKRFFPNEGNSPIILPVNTEVTMYLQDWPPNPERDHFDPDDVAELCRQSPDLVQDVNFAHCHHKDWIQRSIAALANQRSLSALNFYECRLNSETISAVAKLPSLKDLGISSMAAGIDVRIGNILADTSLRKIFVDRAYLPATLEQITKIKSLQEIHISHVGMAQRDLKHVIAQEHVKLLELEKVGLDENTKMDELGNFASLETLEISASSGDIRDYSFLLKLPKLKKFALWDTGLQEKDLKFIAGLGELIDLKVSGQYKLSNSDFAALGKMKRLKTITVNSDQISDKAREMFKSMNVQVKFEEI